MPGRPTRILYLIDRAVSTGGAERLAVGLASHLPGDRFEVWLCATRISDEASRRTLTEAGVRHMTLGRTTKWDVHRLRPLLRTVRQVRFDVVHGHMFGSSLWACLIGTAYRIPTVVAHEHGFAYEAGRLHAWAHGSLIGTVATRYVAVSRPDGRELVREGANPDKVVVMPNAYIPSTTVSDTDIRSELGLDPATPLIAVAAVLRAEKRLDLLLAAHRIVLGGIPEAHLVIAGDGPCRAALEARARELGIAAAVHFLGRRSDVDSLLRAADVAAIASDREGSPLLMFECMANGTPLVATAVGGIPDVVQDGRTGILVPPDDAAALAGALADLLADPARRAELAAAAAERLPQFTIEAATGRFVALYDELVAR